jgi:putative oligomerization/nucleic acid binding protein
MIVRRGPGLLGTMARTAVVAGTATAVSGGVMHRQEARADQAAQAAASEQQKPQQYAQPQQNTDIVSQLKQLADLRASGAISDSEFTAAKRQLLG